MENARGFTPNNPHFFQPLLPGFHRELSIPVYFYKYYLNGHECENAVLRSWGGRTWPVKVEGRTFKDGWENFARDHDLKVGYFLVFELQQGDMVFDVMVFDTSTCQKEYPHFVTKLSKEENQSSSEREEEAKETQNQSTRRRKVSTFKSGDTYFTLTLMPSHFTRFTLLVPLHFARSNGLSNGVREIKLIDEQARSWAANLCRMRNGQLHISRGWRDLCIANGLKIGDSVKLELVKKGKKPEFKFERQFTKRRKVSASAFKPGDTYFTSTLGHSHFIKFRLLVPIQFARSSGLNNRVHEIKLIDEQGRSWAANLCHSKRGRSGQVYISRGWRHLCIANGLKVGDSVKLKLVKKGKKPAIKLERLHMKSKAKPQPSNPNSKVGSSKYGASKR